MRQIAKYLLVVVVLALVIGAVALALLVPVKATSQVAGLEYKVSALRVNWYLAANGYSREVKGLALVLVDSPQTGYQQRGKANKVLKSVSATTTEGGMELKVQYDPIERDNYRGEEGEPYTRDLYMYLCLAIAPGNPTTKECYGRADAQIARERLLPGEAVRVVERKTRTWRLELVKKAHAQSCVGTIQCGGLRSDAVCTGDNKTACNSDNDCDQKGLGTCKGDGAEWCDTSLNPINCKSQTNQNSCQTYGYVSNCAIRCNTSAENFCSWGTGGGGGSCPPECRQGASCGAIQET